MKPMLAVLGKEDMLDRKDHYFEPKLDGIRALCYKKTKLKFTSRNDIVITDKYPEFDFFDDLDAEECILDGEIVVYDEKGNPSFHLWGLKNKGHDIPAVYVAFDVLYYNGNSMLNEPLYVRKKILDKIIKEGDNLQVSLYTKKGRELWKLIKERNLEGVIAKKDDSPYELGKRSDSWIKIKNTNEIDCVILGYTAEKRALTSLALGLYFDKEIRYAGKVGTGFDEDTMEELKERLDKIRLENTAIVTEPGVIPVKPELVVQIKYLEITKSGKLRAPVFMCIRDDKDAGDCIMPVQK